MNLENEALVANLPFIKKFVFEAIIATQKIGVSINNKDVIYADLVPKVSKKVMQASLAYGIIPSKVIEPEKAIYNPKGRPEIKKLSEEYLKRLEEPFKKTPLIVDPVRVLPPVSPAIVPVLHPLQLSKVIRPNLLPPRPVITPAPRSQQRVPTPVHIGAPITLRPVEIGPPIQKDSESKDPHLDEELSNDYGKIKPFLEDKTISSIECPGPGRPIIIIQRGTRMPTKISLSPNEIKGLLNFISDEAHIPLLEGVFRASVDDFTISAVISEIIGSKFIIKKRTPFALLER